MTAAEQNEKEANYFAMHLLVPTEMLRAELNRLGGIDVCDDRTGALKKLAKRFGVSETIIAFRISEESNLSLVNTKMTNMAALPDVRSASDSQAAMFGLASGSRVLVWLNGRATHRTLIRRHGELVFRNQCGFDKLALYEPHNIGAGTTLWKWRNA